MRFLNSHRWKYRLWQWLEKLPEITLTANTRHGRLSFSSKDRVIGEHLFLYGQVDYDEIYTAFNAMQQFNVVKAQNTGYVVDIGANIGTVCIPLVRHGQFARGLAFEPDPYNFQLLCRNINANGLSHQITPFQLGLSNTSGEMQFEHSSHNYGDHRIRVTNSPSGSYDDEAGRQIIHVPVNTLDRVLREKDIHPQDIHLIYMDVQGHEWHVLQGASETLQAGVPMVMEVWPYGLKRAGTDFTALAEFIADVFNNVVDIRGDKARQPASAFATIMANLGAEDFTDVLLWK